MQAISQGCAVVSEHSVSHLPLELGRHLVVGAPESLGLLAAGLLDDEPERARLAREAYELLHDKLPLSRAVQELAAVAEEIAAGPPRRLESPLPVLVSPVGTTLDLDDAFPGPPLGDEDARRSSTMRGALKDLRLEMMQLRRSLRRSDLELGWAGRCPRWRWTSRRRPGTRIPRVSSR